MDAAGLDVALNDSDLVFSLFSPLTPFFPYKTCIKARTSGVLLVAGVGSYCAYRVCTNLLGNRFVWELLESSRMDRIPTADRRLLYSFNVHDGEETEDEEESEERKRQRRRKRMAELEEVMSVTSTSRSPSNMSLSRFSQIRRSSRGKGLYALCGGKPRSGVLSRQSSRHSSCSIPYSIVSSVKSASLRILWEGSQDAWDDEFAAPGTSHQQPSVICRSGAGIQPEDDLASMCSVFNDVLSVTSEGDEANDHEGGDVVSNTEDRSDNDDAEWIRRLQDSKYMYQSMVAASEAGSVSSFRFCESTSGKGTSLQATELDETLSPLSDLKEDLTKSSTSRRSNGRSMYDSAIGADLSSEDGSILGNNHQRLDVLKEDAISMASLEWFDDGLRNREQVAAPAEEQIRSPYEEDQDEWTFDSFERQEVDSQFAPVESRDLMVVACELFQPFSPPFKDLQSLYHKRRFKRLAVVKNEKDFFEAFLRCILYHKVPVSREKRWERLEQRLNRCLQENGSSWTRSRPNRVKTSLQNFLAFARNPSVEVMKLTSVELGEMLRVMCVLEGVGLVDEAVAGLFNESFPFHDMKKFIDEFHYDRFPNLEVVLYLLSRVTGAEIEHHHIHSLSKPPHIQRFNSNSAIHHQDSIVLLSYGKVPSPLYVINDDE